MGNWTPTIKLGPIEFDGDQVTADATRLLVEDMSLLMRHVNPETGKLTFTNPAEVCEIAGRLLPKYIKAVRGYTKADGIAMTVEELASASAEFYFVPLVGGLFAALMEASTVKGQQAKNSAAPSQD